MRSSTASTRRAHLLLRPQGMMPGINDMLEAVCKTKKLDFKEKQEEWKKNGQWHVEVY